MLLIITSGCNVKSEDLLHHFKRPWCILVGMGCQYILLPLLAFCVILAFSLDPNEAVAVMISSTCPCGPASNLVTIAIEGDVSLRYVFCPDSGTFLFLKFLTHYLFGLQCCR